MNNVLKDKQHVPKDHVWIEGDNKKNSTDSREFGPLQVSDIRGRVIFKLNPLRSISTSKHPALREIPVSSKTGNNKLNNNKPQQYALDSDKKPRIIISGLDVAWATLLPRAKK